ncbi:hypothetical protein PMIN03_000476 [Paraphaeosphaeria minitans]|uniref:Secreted protein n=1 Tax=Paraphaeosphaeria minitans TaxID=565426 RepID=A0A9P6GEW6_9PLEO|nr:hypothetical protein PMIN01_07395 [Paraphaeosphaeria minitans]
MQPILRLTFSLLLLFAAGASPHPSRFIRGLAGAVYLCPLRSWQGKCVWRPLGFKPDEPCLSEETGTIPTGFTFGSIGPDAYGECLLYSSTDCGYSDRGRSRIGTLKFPGVPNVMPGVRSLWCWTCKRSDCSDINPLELEINRHEWRAQQQG